LDRRKLLHSRLSLRESSAAFAERKATLFELTVLSFDLFPGFAAVGSKNRVYPRAKTAEILRHYAGKAHCIITGAGQIIPLSGIRPLLSGKVGNAQTGCGGARESASDSLQSVWDESAHEILRLMRALGVPSNRADDLLQDVYIAAWRKRPAGLDREELRRWLFKVATNRCHLEHRKVKRWRAVLQRVARLWSRDDRPHSTSAAEPAYAMFRQEEKLLIRRALQQLNPTVRSLLVLRYFAGFNSAEIGKIMELPESTVRTQLQAARRELALSLKKAGYEHE
jgi:RNA polymerase sigma-70 factor, ECF subfamily